MALMPLRGWHYYQNPQTGFTKGLSQNNLVIFVEQMGLSQNNLVIFVEQILIKLIKFVQVIL